MTETNQLEHKMTIMQRIGEHAENKRLISRIITFIILSIAVYEELFTPERITDNWMELTKWCLLYYFSRAAVQKVAQYVSAKNKS